MGFAALNPSYIPCLDGLKLIRTSAHEGAQLVGA